MVILSARQVFHYKLHFITSYIIMRSGGPFTFNTLQKSHQAITRRDGLSVGINLFTDLGWREICSAFYDRDERVGDSLSTSCERATNGYTLRPDDTMDLHCLSLPRD
jgi:hypothetical protein